MTNDTSPVRISHDTYLDKSLECSVREARPGAAAGAGIGEQCALVAIEPRRGKNRIGPDTVDIRHRGEAALRADLM